MNRSTRPVALGAVLAATLALALAGCGGDNNNNDSAGSKPTTESSSYGSSGGGSGGGGAKLALAADPGGKIAYDKTALAGKSGKNTIDFTNDSQIPHAVEVEGNGVEEKTKTITGGKATLTVDLKPGTYDFYCPVDSHRQQGMKGKLTVK